MKETLNGRMVQLAEKLVGSGLTLSQGVREFEKQYIVATLRGNDGNLTRSAEALGIHRNTLRNKVSSLKIRPADIATASKRRRQTARR
ncbi:MAG: helix-turn-helix domain-containing protein [Acidobacteriota bacterium]|nr:helix-turn-helix domain-containing protein [Acidobacteriota bacterium]